MALPALVLAALMLFGPATQAWYAIPLMICAGLLRVSARWLEGIGITVNCLGVGLHPGVGDLAGRRCLHLGGNDHDGAGALALFSGQSAGRGS